MKFSTFILRPVAALAIAMVALALASCQTTGDPNQGGLFGWSEQKAQGRIYERERELDHAGSRANAVQNENLRLEGRRDGLRY